MITCIKCFDNCLWMNKHSRKFENALLVFRKINENKKYLLLGIIYVTFMLMFYSVINSSPIIIFAYTIKPL